MSVAGHGKGEIDHVEGTAKVAGSRKIAAGKYFLTVTTSLIFL